MLAVAFAQDAIFRNAAAYKKRMKSKVSTWQSAGINLIPDLTSNVFKPSRFQKRRFTPFLAAHADQSLRDTGTPDKAKQGV